MCSRWLSIGISSANGYLEAETEISEHGESQQLTNVIDRFYKAVAPERALKRQHARMKLNALEGFSGASKKRKSTSRWRTLNNDPGEILLDAKEILSERSEDLDRNNPLACGAISSLEENIIGTGLRVQSMIDSSYLGLTDDEASEWQAQAERIFKLWACKQTADAKQEQNFYSMQATAFVAALLTGDCFAQRQFRKSDFLGTCWRLVDSTRVCNPGKATDTRKISGGIERDAFGAPRIYHVTNIHPWSTKEKIVWRQISPYSRDGYTRDFIHAFRKRAVSEPRGRPILSPVIEALKQIGRYTEAELQAAVVSGLFTVFVKSPDGNVEIDAFDGDQEESEPEDPDYGLGNGAVVGLAEGEEITTANPGRPNSGFDPFVLAILRQIGVALGLPYELMIKHFTASYSASRAALNEAQRSFRQRRKWFADSFCQPIYESVIIEAVSKGYLSAPGFFDDYQVRSAYLSTQWAGDAWGSLDPLKDVNAAEKRLDLGITTRSQETLEYNGGDYEKNAMQRTKESKLEREIKGNESTQRNDVSSMGNNTDSLGEDDIDSEEGERPESF